GLPPGRPIYLVRLRPPLAALGQLSFLQRPWRRVTDVVVEACRADLVRARRLLSPEVQHGWRRPRHGFNNRAFTAFAARNGRPASLASVSSCTTFQAPPSESRISTLTSVEHPAVKLRLPIVSLDQRDWRRRRRC